MRFLQPEVHADRVQRVVALRQAQRAVQQAAALVALDRDVAVLVVDDREARQHRVAVVAVRVDRIAAVGELRPELVGQVFVVRRLRPARDALRRAASCEPCTSCRNTTSAPTGPHRLAQLAQHEAAVRGRRSPCACSRSARGRRRSGSRGSLRPCRTTLFYPARRPTAVGDRRPGVQAGAAAILCGPVVSTRSIAAIHMTARKGLFQADDGLLRCAWCRASPAYRQYHDHEWGFPVSRRPAPVREALPRRVPGRPQLAHHPQQARGVPARLRRTSRPSASPASARAT